MHTLDILGLGIGALLLVRLVYQVSSRRLAGMTDQQLTAAVQEADDWAESESYATCELDRRSASTSRQAAPAEPCGPHLAPNPALSLRAVN